MREDHQEEVDILLSIYPEEVSVIDDTSLSIALELDTVPPKSLHLHIELPQLYPETEAPIVHCSVEKDTAPVGDDDKQVDSFVYSLSETDMKSLDLKAKELSEGMIGMQSLYTVIAGLKEEAEMLYDQGIAELQAARTRAIDLEEKKEQSKFHGTPVNKETFAAWREKFRAETRPKDPKTETVSLTGKEIFEQGIQGETDDEDENEDASV